MAIRRMRHSVYRSVSLDNGRVNTISLHVMWHFIGDADDGLRICVRRGLEMTLSRHGLEVCILFQGAVTYFETKSG